jgi:hypothetical protein
LIQHLPDIKTKNVLDYINQNHAKSPDKILLLKGKESYYLIKSLIEEITKNAKSRNNRTR